MPCQWFKSVQTIEVPTGSPNLSFFPSFFFLQDSSCGLLCNQLCNVWTKLVLKYNRKRASTTLSIVTQLMPYT